jgi:caffeoyl-CoA O-methyltransferase
MNYIDKKLSDYCENHSSNEPDFLAEINRQTHLTQINPRMLSGNLQGQFLKLITQIIRPKRVLEIGTYTGYSAICMAQGLSKDGQIDTIEINEELESVILKNIDQSQLNDKINLHLGDALGIIDQLLKIHTYDLVFIDADKINYPNYFNLLKSHLKMGAILMADNVLWSGKIIDDFELANDVETKAIHHFNSLLKNDLSFEKVVLPIRDGITLARKCC